MGHNVSTETKEQTQRNKQIEKQLSEDNSRRPYKLLLLGPGNSGKSTIAKQMRLMHNQEFDESEKLLARPLILQLCVSTMARIINGMKASEIRFKNPWRQIDAAVVMRAVEFRMNRDVLDRGAYHGLKRLWSDEGVQRCFQLHSSELHIPDSAKYFLDDLDRLYSRGYVPSQTDMLRFRVPTNGCVEIKIKMSGSRRDLQVIDAGGQRSQRRKWLQFFDDASAVIFVASMSDYDQTIEEDNETNGMHESLRVFDEICNNPYFISVAMILFLNKKDIFEEKIKSSPLIVAFPEYKGTQTYAESSEFLRKKFKETNANKQKEVYTHFTCATDNRQIQAVISSSLHIIISKHSQRAGIM